MSDISRVKTLLRRRPSLTTWKPALTPRRRRDITLLACSEAAPTPTTRPAATRESARRRGKTTSAGGGAMTDFYNRKVTCGKEGSSALVQLSSLSLPRRYHLQHLFSPVPRALNTNSSNCSSQRSRNQRDNRAEGPCGARGRGCAHCPMERTRANSGKSSQELPPPGEHEGSAQRKSSNRMANLRRKMIWPTKKSPNTSQVDKSRVTPRGNMTYT